MADMNEKAIEAANELDSLYAQCAIKDRGQNVPTDFDDGAWHRFDVASRRAWPKITAALRAAQPLMGAREEIARYIANNSATAGWQAYRLTDDILAILSSGQEWRVPEGWQLVPKELTEWMEEKAIHIADGPDITPQEHWSTMLAAAPASCRAEGINK